MNLLLNKIHKLLGIDKKEAILEKRWNKIIRKLTVIEKTMRSV